MTVKMKGKNMGLFINGVQNTGSVAGAGQVSTPQKTEGKMNIFAGFFGRASKVEQNPTVGIPQNEQFTPAKKDGEPPVAVKLPLDVE